MNVEAALKEYRPLVRRIAVTMVAKCPPNVELDDLIQEGMMGLYESVGRFNS
jgi:RNA polymerase sigma factor for flagellar operon FliA